MNTHYNIIDSLIFAFGQDNWNIITNILFNTLDENNNIDNFIPPHKDIFKYIQDNKNTSISLNKEKHHHFATILSDMVDWHELERKIQRMVQVQVSYTICENFLWAMTEGSISNHWGYGFKR